MVLGTPSKSGKVIRQEILNGANPCDKSQAFKANGTAQIARICANSGVPLINSIYAVDILDMTGPP
jgi:hypothetical protein